MLMRPKSTGWVSLASTDIKDKPLITPNYFDDPEDVRILVKGIKAAMALGNTKAARDSGSVVVNGTMVGCEDYELDSDEYWDCVIRTWTITTYHYVGTCKMGPRDDRSAVVDSKLRVIGVDRLRVNDASIMPTEITGHTVIPTMMIAERASDVIKQRWKYCARR